MPLAPGARLGPYEVIAAVGEGGMGEVYRGRDTKLNRDVALKVLPASVASDPDRLARFHREAQVLASLNHPHIGAIYGFEDSGETHALVLEFVDGPTLADRIAQGPIPVDEALPIAIQIAQALEAAHEQGIIHRDLKPANIKLRPDGTVKVLDFGLAKLSEPGFGVRNSGFDGSLSPTITSPALMTGVGVLLGTAAYMAPEQARGKAVDKRADIWAFGCVLFEMLAGMRPFEGDATTDVVVAILTKEPDWSALPASIPVRVAETLRRCLTKDPRERLRDIGDARIEFERTDALPRPAPTPLNRPVRTFAAGVAAGALLIAFGAFLWFSTSEETPDVERFGITPSGEAAITPNGSVITAGRDVGISPDGTRVVWVGRNGAQLFIRTLDSLQAVPLGQVGAPRHPFFSPDGGWVGFFDGTTLLKKVAFNGGPAVTICRIVGVPRGAAWGADDTIVFATNDRTSGLWKVAAGGGEPTMITTPQSGEEDHLWPEFLPGTQQVLFTIVPSGMSIDRARIASFDLRTGVQKSLIDGGSDAHYIERTGHLVYGASGTLRAAAFDAAALRVTSSPVPVVQSVSANRYGESNFDVAANGTLVYVPSSVEALARTLVWVDRTGREEALGSPPRGYQYPRLSHDGTHLAVDVRDEDNDIWIWDFGRKTLTRFTFGTGQDEYPVWTPDDRRLIFSSGPTETMNLFWQPVDGGGAPERLTNSRRDQRSYSISPDGDRLVFREDAQTEDLLLLNLSPPYTAHPLVQTTFKETNGEISPDGKWLAYQSNDAGQDQIYVRSFSGSGGKWQISTAGGLQPLWARNGGELFYLDLNGALMSVTVSRGSSWSATAPTKLFEGPYFFGGAVTNAAGRTYDVSNDGRFIRIKLPAVTDQIAPNRSVVIVKNWFDELKRLVPAK